MSRPLSWLFAALMMAALAVSTGCSPGGDGDAPASGTSPSASASASAAANTKQTACKRSAKVSTAEDKSEFNGKAGVMLDIRVCGKEGDKVYVFDWSEGDEYYLMADGLDSHGAPLTTPGPVATITIRADMVGPVPGAEHRFNYLDKPIGNPGRGETEFTVVVADAVCLADLRLPAPNAKGDILVADFPASCTKDQKTVMTVA